MAIMLRGIAICAMAIIRTYSKESTDDFLPRTVPSMAKSVLSGIISGRGVVISVFICPWDFASLFTQD